MARPDVRGGHGIHHRGSSRCRYVPATKHCLAWASLCPRSRLRETRWQTGGRRFHSQLRIAELRLIKRWSPVIAIDTKGLRLFVHTRDDGVARQIVLHGPHEADTIGAAIETLELLGCSPFARQGQMFLDIGANIGTSIIQAICHHGAAGGTAFEPHPGNITLLRHNLLANHVADRVSVVQCARSPTPAAPSC